MNRAHSLLQPSPTGATGPSSRPARTTDRLTTAPPARHGPAETRRALGPLQRRATRHRPADGRLRRWALGFIAALLPALVPAQEAGVPQQLSAVRLNAGMHNIHAQLATTPAQRAIGLMHVTEMKPNDGMLFVFEHAGVQCFWMRNTLIPLSIAFLDAEGRIVNLDEMRPMRDDSHCSSAPVRHVLEMNTGWFSQRGLKPGDRIGGGPFPVPR